MINKRILTLSAAILVPAAAFLGGAGDATVERLGYAFAKGRSEATLDTLEERGDLENAFQLVAEAVLPSVVRISTTQVSRGFRDSFGFFERPLPTKGVGSGVIVDEDGIILTNHHVVRGAQKVEVRLSDGRRLPAEVIGSDPRTDIAVVRVKAKGLRPARLGNSDEAKVGQWVLAFGSPFGLDTSVTSGIISAKGRAGLGIAAYEDLIQTDAAINHGNSGGPLVDLQGRIVGINVAIMSRSGGSQGIAFSIPVNQARVIMERLVESGHVTRGWLGVSMESMNPELATTVGFQGGNGIILHEIQDKGPASAGGLLPRDVLLAMNGRRLGDSAVFQTMIASTPPGEKVNFRVWRQGKVVAVDVTIRERP